MLEGKRNRHLDHLIFTLIEKVVPYFQSRHWRQQFGFEGPDLEMKRRMEINERAMLIPIDDIEESESQTFRVHSQTDRTRWYTVDLETYTCDSSCESFPVIMFCKHIAAVQLHFEEAITQLHLSSIFTKPTTRPLQRYIDSHTPSAASPPQPTVLNVDDIKLAALSNKLQQLAIRTHLQPPSHLSDTLRTLDSLLNIVLSQVSDSGVLPKQKKIAPNQHSWTETKEVMVAKPKTSKRTSETADPYGGGGVAGKKAKPDARVAKKVAAVGAMR